MPSVSFGGFGNGIDYGQVVDQLVKVARLPIERLTDKQAALNSKFTDYTTLTTKIMALQSAAGALRLPSLFDRTSVSVSDTTVLTASGSSTATAGHYTIRVSQLAQAHQITNVAAKTVASTTADIVAGASGTFSFTVAGGATHTVTLTATGTLEDLRSGINDLGAGVSASIVNTGSDTTPAYRLVLTAGNTGDANELVIVADDTVLDFLNTTGTGGTDTLQAAQDAVIVVGDPALNPVTIQRSSNTITDAVAGVTLSLTETTGTDTVSVNVTQDVAAVKTNIKALATAYNDVVKFINERNTYDVNTKKGGIFFNEPTVRGILSQIGTALSTTVSGSTAFESVGQVGFKTERDGTITVDDATLDAAFSTSYTAVKNLFVRQTTTTGIAQLLVDAVDKLDDIAAGPLPLRKTGITSEIARLTADIARKEDRLAEYEARLRRQYAALDALLGQLQSQMGYLQASTSTKS
ncbi:MAG: flagellar filament capping protein FliD [Nitrospiraceae bacterium]|nr:flagellar filament capping protein FliD [Nitrospiraceae bacterium]